MSLLAIREDLFSSAAQELCFSSIIRSKNGQRKFSPWGERDANFVALIHLRGENIFAPILPKKIAKEERGGGLSPAASKQNLDAQKS